METLHYVMSTGKVEAVTVQDETEQLSAEEALTLQDEMVAGALGLSVEALYRREGRRREGRVRHRPALYLAVTGGGKKGKGDTLDEFTADTSEGGIQDQMVAGALGVAVEQLKV